MKSKKIFFITISIICCFFTNTFSYEKLNQDYLNQLIIQFRTAYNEGTLTRDQIERELSSFNQFKEHVQNWLNASDQNNSEKAKKVVTADIKQLETKKDSKLSNHFVKEFYSIQGDDKKAINNMIHDIDSIISMYKEFLNSTKSIN